MIDRKRDREMMMIRIIKEMVLSLRMYAKTIISESMNLGRK